MGERERGLWRRKRRGMWDERREFIVGLDQLRTSSCGLVGFGILALVWFL